MLVLNLSPLEGFNESTNEFVTIPRGKLELEHSLVSLSKWESKWHKPFLGRDEKSDEELLDYIRCMTLNDPDPSVYSSLRASEVRKINEYIDDPYTATTFRKNGKKSPSREIVTSELIYYWMVALNIPSEYQSWHLNRLITLIEVCNIKNAPPKKMSKSEIYSRNKAINEANRRRFHTKG